MNNTDTVNTNDTNVTTETVVSDKKKVRLRVITPMQVVYDKPVDMVIAKTVKGDIGVLRNHDPRAALLGDGVLRIFENIKQDEDLLMILGGVFTVRDNEVTVLSEIAERPEKIQELLQRLETERTASMIVEQETELYTKRMEMALRRALVQVDFNDSMYDLL